MRMLAHLGLIVLAAAGCGQVERRMTINSEPSGALVYLNGREVGRTPTTVDFTWYGRYELILRKEDQEPLKTTQTVIAPWWQWVPIDLLAELTPGRKVDRHEYTFALQKQSETGVPPAVLIDRAASMRPMLESGEFTRKPTSRPTTAPVSSTP